MIYALRYERHPNSELNNMRNLLKTADAQPEQLALIDSILKYASSSQRCGDAFGNKNFIQSRFKNFSRGLKGVSNIYTEHKPLLKSTLEAIQTNRLKEQEYPFATRPQSRDPPQDVIVFIVGGVTFEEAVTVHDFNSANSNFRVVLGGTFIHNSKSFLADISNKILLSRTST